MYILNSIEIILVIFIPSLLSQSINVTSSNFNKTLSFNNDTFVNNGSLPYENSEFSEINNNQSKINDKLTNSFTNSVKNNAFNENINPETNNSEEYSDYNEDYNEDSNLSLKNMSAEALALKRLRNFLMETVGIGIKNTLPTLVQSVLETNISSECTASFMILVKGLQEGKGWAFRMLDASGKPPSGILEGTLTDFGSFEECVNLEVDSNDSVNKSENFKGKYCIIDVRAAFDSNIDLDSSPPNNIENDSIVWEPALRIFWSRNNLLSFRYGTCIPSTCSREEIEEIANILIEPTGLELNVSNCQMNKTFEVDSLQIFILGVFGLIILIVIIGTSIELYFISNGEKKLLLSSEKSWLNLFVSFSLYRNTKIVLDTDKVNMSLKHLDGVRFLSVAWIIMGHTYFYTDFVHYHHYRRLKHFQNIDDDFIFMPIANFTLSVDTFFFISGLLAVYANWKKLKLSDGKISVSRFLFHRIWRIWPPYFAIIGLVLLMPIIGSGPLWPQAVESTAKLCRANWWTNILFFNNFLAPDKLCLLHTWFVSAYIQFHLFSAFILFLLYRYPKITLGLLGVSIVLSGISVFVYTTINKVTWPTVIADEVFIDHENKILTLYIMPYNHLGCYLVGIIFGYMLVKYNNVMISTRNQLIAWIFSFGLLSLVIFAPYQAFAGHKFTIFQSGLYLSTHRIAWSIGLGWVVYACSTNRGGIIDKLLSWSVFSPLSSLSYLAYLVHPLLMLWHTGRIRERIYFGHYEFINIFLARIVMAFGLAYLLYVTIEIPFSNFEKYLFPKKSVSKTSEYRPNSTPIFSISSVPSLTTCKRTENA